MRLNTTLLPLWSSFDGHSEALRGSRLMVFQKQPRTTESGARVPTLVGFFTNKEKARLKPVLYWQNMGRLRKI
jgi:hypothetical protein